MTPTATNAFETQKIEKNKKTTTKNAIHNPHIPTAYPFIDYIEMPQKNPAHVIPQNYRNARGMCECRLFLLNSIYERKRGRVGLNNDWLKFQLKILF